MPGTSRCALAAAFIVALTATAAAQQACGHLVTLETHGGSTTSYSLAQPPESASPNGRSVLVLLPGAAGYMALDDNGCATRLKGNWLVRSRGLFQAAGFVTALVDAPSDHRGKDGLGGFRLSARHARDIGEVIADVRRRTGLPVWLVGTSRGTISAASAASRLAGPDAPDGLVLASPITAGRTGGRKAFRAQTVLDTWLENIRMPLLVVVNVADTCARTPPGLAPAIAARVNSGRQQLVTVTGGPGVRPGTHAGACGGRSPHGFIGQEAEVAAGIARFVRGGTY